VHVETADESAADCPSCGVASTSVKQYVRTTPRDLPYGEKGISVVWHKRRWRCVEPDCARGSFTEAIGEVPSGWRTTGRLRRAIAFAVGDAGRSVAEVAGSFGVPWPTADAAVAQGRTSRLHRSRYAPNRDATASGTTAGHKPGDRILGLADQPAPGLVPLGLSGFPQQRIKVLLVLVPSRTPRRAQDTLRGTGHACTAISRCHQTTPEACTRRSTSRSMRSDGGYRVLTRLADGYPVE